MSSVDTGHSNGFRIADRPNWSQALARLATGASGQIFSRYGLLLAFLVLWQISPSLGWTDPAVLPPLDQILGALWNGVAGGPLVGDIAISLQRSGIAFGAAVLIGVPLGLLMGQLRGVERSLDPILQLFRQTSALALYPVFILLHACTSWWPTRRSSCSVVIRRPTLPQEGNASGRGSDAM
jgi:sulfonate transport system permease protein